MPKAVRNARAGDLRRPGRAEPAEVATVHPAPGTAESADPAGQPMNSTEPRARPAT
jgi:hypothetical protein